jgi:putative membrane protein
MKKIFSALLVISTVYMLPGCNNENSSNKNAEKQNDAKFDSTNVKRDADFAVEAASGGMMEVELGKIAEANAASAQVKEFGQHMVSDHSKGNDELKATAQTKGITLPAVPDEKKQKKIDDLKQKKGADFDKAYIDMMVDDHKEDIDLFQKESDKGNDPDLKTWAGGKLPLLQHHLQMAEDIQKGLKK